MARLPRFFSRLLALALPLALLLAATSSWLPGSRSLAGDSPATPSAFETLAASKDWLNVARPPTTDELSGRIVLLDFWTFCCVNCMHVIPDLKALEKEFGSSLLVIGVHSPKFANEKETASIREAVLRYGLEHPVVNDRDFRLWKSFKVNCWPMLVLVNPKGAIEVAYRGEGHLAQLRADIERLKKESGSSLKTAPLPLALEKDKLAPGPLLFPGKLASAPDRNLIFVSDSNHERILGLDPTGEVRLEIGRKDDAGATDGGFDEARFRHPQGLAYGNGVLYVADTDNHLLRKVDLEARKVSTIAGTGKQGAILKTTGSPALETALSSPWDLALDLEANRLLVAMAGVHQIWAVDLGGATVTPIAGNGTESIVDGANPANALSQPSGVSLAPGKGPSDDRLFFVDSETSSLRVLEGGKVTTLLGKGLFDFGLKDGARDVARLQHPLGLWADATQVFIADSYNHAIRRFDVASGKLETLAGNGTPGLVDGAFEAARFAEPAGVLKLGDKLFVTDTNNHALRVLDLGKRTVSTLPVSEKGESKPLDSPRGKSSRATPAGADSLPLLDKQAAAPVAPGKALEIHVTLETGFHASNDGESWLAVYRSEGEGPWSLVQNLDRPALPLEVKLPSITTGVRYRVQGTFAYCKGGDDGVCLLRSFDREVVASPDGHETLVELALTGPR